MVPIAAPIPENPKADNNHLPVEVSKWILKRIGPYRDRNLSKIGLKIGQTHIGRVSDERFRNDLCIPSDMCSRNHAVITVSKHSIRIEDKNSSNGIYVNTEIHKNEELMLSEGDVIGFGVPIRGASSNQSYYVYRLKVNRYVDTPDDAVIELDSEEEEDDDDEEVIILSDTEEDNIDSNRKVKVEKNADNQIQSTANKTDDYSTDEDTENNNTYSQVVMDSIKEEAIDLQEQLCNKKDDDDNYVEYDEEWLRKLSQNVGKNISNGPINLTLEPLDLSAKSNNLSVDTIGAPTVDVDSDDDEPVFFTKFLQDIDRTVPTPESAKNRTTSEESDRATPDYQQPSTSKAIIKDRCGTLKLNESRDRRDSERSDKSDKSDKSDRSHHKSHKSHKSRESNHKIVKKSDKFRRISSNEKNCKPKITNIDKKHLSDKEIVRELSNNNIENDRLVLQPKILSNPESPKTNHHQPKKSVPKRSGPPTLIAALPLKRAKRLNSVSRPPVSTVKLNSDDKRLRIDRLKELAQSKKKYEIDDDVRIISKPRVKMTLNNRGAFLAEGAVVAKPEPRKSKLIDIQDIKVEPIDSDCVPSTSTDKSSGNNKRPPNDPSDADAKRKKIDNNCVSSTSDNQSMESNKQPPNDQLIPFHPMKPSDSNGLNVPKKPVATVPPLMELEVSAPLPPLPNPKNRIQKRRNTIVCSFNTNFEKNIPIPKPRLALKLIELPSNQMISPQSHIRFRRASVHSFVPTPKPTEINTKTEMNGLGSAKDPKPSDDILVRPSPINGNKKDQLPDEPRKSCLKNPLTPTRRRELSVSFPNADKPDVIYIEKYINDMEMDVDVQVVEESISREMNANKYVDKDGPVPTIMRNTSNQAGVNEVILSVTNWNPNWLNERNEIPVNGIDFTYMPIIDEYDSIDDFKSTLLPIMKVELFRTIQQEYTDRTQYNNWIETVVQMVVEGSRANGKYYVFSCEVPNWVPDNNKIKVGDLLLVQYEDKFKRTNKFFSYVVAANITGGRNVYFKMESAIASSMTIEEANRLCTIQIKAVSYIRVELSGFYSIFALDYSPLKRNILRPMLNKLDPPVSISNLKYDGYDDLNAFQKTALLKAYARCADPRPSITLIEGPPGTGKSTLIVNLALQCIYGTLTKHKWKLLICAQSNAAVDNIAYQLQKIKSKMKSCKDKSFKVYRFGVFNKMNPNVRDISCQNLSNEVADNTMVDENARELARLNKQSGELQLKIKSAELNFKRNQLNNNLKTELEELRRRHKVLQQTIHQLSGSDSNYRQSLHEANVICTTLGSCANLKQLAWNVDVCIIDEATQATEPQTFSPLDLSCKSIVLVGDSKQLPATVISKFAKDYGFEQSLFARIRRLYDDTDTETVLSLREQYRMHPSICEWPNKYFYNQQLITHSSTVDNSFPLQPYVVISVTNSNKKGVTYSNNEEVEMVFELLESLAVHASPATYSYGILCPYTEQRMAIQAKLDTTNSLKTVFVNTIDSFQGLEKDVTILCTTRTKNGAGFLDVPQRLNVAVTRAKKCLIICGDFISVKKIDAWKSLLDDATTRNCLIEVDYQKRNITNIMPKILKENNVL